MAAHGARGGFVRAGAARREERTYAETLALAGALAVEMRRAGVAPGDRILLILEDGPLWAAAFCASLACGGVSVPLDTSSLPEFLDAVARRCGARIVLHDGRTRALPASVTAIDAAALAAARPEGAPLPEPLPDPEPSALAEIVFTSGTTAAPRGVMITHENVLTALRGIEAGIVARRRLLAPFTPLPIVNLVPLSHLFGQALGIFIPVILGARVVFSPTRPPRALLRVCREEKAWVLIAVPRHLAALRAHAESIVAPGREPLSKRWWVRALRSRPLVKEHGWRLRALVIGGARLDPDLERYWKDLGYLVVVGYGLTETAPIVSISNPFDDRVGLLGRPGRAQEVRIAEDGEILVRGANVTPGYFEDAEATRAALEGGWLHTGDLGVFGPDGTLRFLGRKKDVIVTGEGQNVFPDEVEEVLRRQTGVKDVCVVAVRGDRGEEVHAAILADAAPGASASNAVAAAVSAANEKLAPHQRARGWTIWSDLDFPRTATGKVLRREVARVVKERLGAAAVAPGAGPAPETGAGVGAEGPLASLRSLAGPGARADQRLGAELGLSSIDIAELSAEIEERYGVEVDPTKIHEDASLGEILEDARARAGAPSERWPMPRWARSAPARAARSVLQALFVMPALRLFAAMRVTGRERIADLRPPFLICANHASHLDVPLLLAAMPRPLRRRVAVAMQPGYFETYLRGTARLFERLRLGWAYGLVTLLLNTFPFPRSAAFRVALEYAGEMAGRGWSILVFPEGVLSLDGAVQAFRPGLGVLARELRLSVVPARIEGAFEILPVGGRFPRTIRGPVRVAWGEPMSMPAGEAPESFAARVREAVLEAPVSGSS